MRLTDEQIAAIRDGTEGVTPGPYGTTRKGEIGPYSQADDQSFGMVIPLADVYGDNAKLDQQHLSRCDPDTIRALATEVLESRAVLDVDRLTDIITDSIDLDWTPRDAAKAIVRAMKANDLETIAKETDR